MFFICVILPINPLIIDKVNSLDVPDSIKEIIQEILRVEDYMEGAKNDKLSSINKILEKYAEQSEVKDFCDKK